MSSKKKIAIVAPLILVVVMYPVFQLLAGAYGSKAGWYLGLVIYWLVWGAAFPLLIIGKGNIRKIIRPHKLDKKVLLLVSFPLLIAVVNKFMHIIEYERTDIWTPLYLLSTVFGNGFFEEVLWRGVYMEMFPASNLFRIVWPSIWFGIWHYAPGSVSANSNVVGLMVGAGLFGFYLSYLAKKTNTLWWSIITHTASGMIIIV